MAIYLKKFENHTQYETYINGSGAILPNVSICTTEGDVHYNPSTPPTPSYETVDLGLPSGTLWARYNVGATSETEYGNYYGYGKGAKIHQETSGESYYTGVENPLAASADTATQSWGGQWHMPTQTQFLELMRNTTYEWTTINGVNGGKFTAQNGNYVFFPAAGSYFGSEYTKNNVRGDYWTSTPNGSSEAYSFYCVDGDWDTINIERSDLGEDAVGNSIRPVVG